MRILVVDDEAAVREAYRLTLANHQGNGAGSASHALANELFDEAGAGPKTSQSGFEITFAEQGLEAVRLVGEALANGKPYKVIFIDVRMPPGIDGKETARRIRAMDSDVNIVIVTGYSDHSVTDIATVAGPADKLFYICKPFAVEEVRHMAMALCQRWDHDTEQLAILRAKMAEIAASEARAQHLASHDFLTGAPNRMAFQHELGKALKKDRTGLALAFLDLDRFKYVNDSFGHAAGDALLVEVYQKLRDQAPGDAVIARLGGDEFGLLFHANSFADAQSVCRDLVESCTGYFTVFGSSARIGASCGLVDCLAYPESDGEELLRYADLALFAAKRSGREQVWVYDDDLDTSQQFRQGIEAGLRQALENKELTLHYQPVVSQGSLEPVGYEALLRWHSQEHGNISPSVFIPIAEESGLIQDIGLWVIEKALQDAMAWPGKIISVNVSPRQFKRADFPQSLLAIARRIGIEPERVQLEITETAFFMDIENAMQSLDSLRSMGFKVALDDFGTGYSSMFNLKSFEVDCIKIDRSFISELGQDRNSAAIVSAIIYLARNLGLSTVAEGVEQLEQCQALRLVGCTHMQGYLFGRPVPASVTSEHFSEQGDLNLDPANKSGDRDGGEVRNAVG